MDSLPQGLGGVAGQDRHRLLHEYRPGVGPVGRHGHALESTLDQVAKVRALARDTDAQLHEIETRSGPDCLTTSPTTVAPAGTLPAFTTTIMPSPMLKVPSISTSVTRPRFW